MAVDHFDAAVDRLAGVGVDQGCKPTGHRVALGALVAPAGDVAGHVLGGEIITIVPLDPLADVQGVDGGVVVDFPAVQKHAAERAVVVVLDQVFQGAAGLVAHFGPVIGARVLQRAHAHLHAQGAAGLGVAAGLRGRVQTDHPVGRGRGHAEHGRAGQKFAAAELAVLVFLRVHMRRRVDRFSVNCRTVHVNLPVSPIFRAVSRGPAPSGGERSQVEVVSAIGGSPCGSFGNRNPNPSTGGMLFT